MVDSVKNLVSRIDPQNKSVVQKASTETEAKTSASGRVTSPGQEALLRFQIFRTYLKSLQLTLRLSNGLKLLYLRVNTLSI